MIKSGVSQLSPYLLIVILSMVLGCGNTSTVLSEVDAGPSADIDTDADLASDRNLDSATGTESGTETDPPITGKKYYVDRDSIGGACSDSNPGTLTEPWCSIAAASATLVPGDAVYIREGTYNEMVSPSRSGTAGNYVTYQNYNDEKVIIDAQNGARSFCIDVNNKDYLRFKGLTLSGASVGWAAGFRGTGGSDHLILDNITAQNSRFGIMLHGDDNSVSQVIIKNCTVFENASHGIFLYMKVYDTFIGPDNHISYNDDETYAHGIEIATDYPGSQDDGSRRIKVLENEVDHNGMQGIRTWNAVDILIESNYCHHNGATGIQIEDGSENIVLDDNICEENSQTYEYETGIWVDGAKNAIVRNNLLRANKIGLMVTDTIFAVLRNNIVSQNNRGAEHLLNTMGINLDNNASDVIVVHNTLYKNGHPSGQRGGMTVGAYHPPVPRAVIKNNIISETAVSRDIYVSVDYLSDYNNYHNTRDLLINWQNSDISWSQYRSSSGQDSHSISQDPLFVSPDNGDFHLQTNSPCRGKGDFLTKATSSGSGTSIQLEEARYFTDGFAVVDGDLVQIGSNDPVRINEIDYSTRTISIDRKISWNNGDGVSYPYNGSVPDMGAYGHTDP